jgi:L-lactate dehydrogenase complex protein LldE
VLERSGRGTTLGRRDQPGSRAHSLPPMRVALFVTCLVDQLYPQVGVSTVRLLRRLGCTVEFPRDQTCCGQPPFNSGFRPEARRIARSWLEAFAHADCIVTPSGSCGGMVHHGYAELFAGEPDLAEEAAKLAQRTHELSRFLVHVLRAEQLGARFPHRVTYHPSCHGTRLLGVRDEPLRLLRAVDGIELVSLPHAEDCCGFGGLFSVKLPDLSGAMVGEKVDHITATAAEYVAGTDMGCLMNIEGHLRQRGLPTRALHLAELLDRAGAGSGLRV